jgi:uncharacterized protein YkwD
MIGMRLRGLGGVVVLAVVAGGCVADDALFGPADTDGGSSSPQIPSNDYCAPVQSWDAALVDGEDEVLDLVNEERASGGTCAGQAMPPVPPLRSSGALRCAARVHSKDMFDRGFFDHTNPDGEDPFVRMERAGYSYFKAGENIAYNYPTPADVVAGWLDSPGHCRNILDGDFTEIGVGYYADNGSGHMWTQTFGVPQ